MGRELKRVPLDFEWPLKKIWGGYLNPFYRHSKRCPFCEGSGLSPETKLLHDQWYGNAPFDPPSTGSTPFSVDNELVRSLARRNVERSPSYYGSGESAIRREAVRLCAHFNRGWMHHLDTDDVKALLDADRLWDFIRVPRNQEQAEIVRQKIADGENSWLPESNGYIPTPQEVNEWSIAGLGHDGINNSVCVSAKAKRLGITETECKFCAGEGNIWESPELKKKSQDWIETEPPIGDGYQLWSTTSEGSPASPVFSTLDELCEWCAKHATTFADYKASAEGWREMLTDGFVAAVVGNNICM